LQSFSATDPLSDAEFQIKKKAEFIRLRRDSLWCVGAARCLHH